MAYLHESKHPKNMQLTRKLVPLIINLTQPKKATTQKKRKSEREKFQPQERIIRQQISGGMNRDEMR